MKSLTRSLALACLCSLRLATASPAQELDPFMARHDLLWERLPEKPRDAAHFGNGLLGSMIMADPHHKFLRLQIFRSDVQDHRDNSSGGVAYARPRLLIGEFHLNTLGTLTGCQLRQDLWNAQLTGTITTDRGNITLRHFVHADDLAIATELKASEGEKTCQWTWHPAPAATTRAGLPTTEEQRQAFIKRYGEKFRDMKVWIPNPEGRQEQRAAVNLWVQDLLVGGQYATAWQERSDPDGTRTSIISIANSYPARTAAEAAAATVADCQNKPPAQWIQAHQRWWHDYYRQSFISIPDTRLESAYWGSVYRWGASARAGRGYMDTSGIWFQGGGWPYTTTNFNLQSCLWGVYSANRLGIGASLVETLQRNQQALIDSVENPAWRADSAFVSRAVAPDFLGSPGKPGEPEVGLLPWTLHNAWLQYRYSMDESILRDTVYPLLRRAVNYYRHLTHEGTDGRIHLTETFSPESGPHPDCNFDLSLFHWGIQTLLWSAERLKIDDPLIPVWKDLQSRLVDFPADQQGFRFGATRSFDGAHRHASHLLMVYPLSIITTDQVKWRELIRTSAQSYGACDSRLLAMVGLQSAPIAAVAGLPELAYQRINWHNDDLSPAGFGDSSGWCMEGAVAIANSIQMLLIQSHGQRIRVFPAMPKAWPEAVFRDLRTEGAFLVSARREGGRTRWVQIKSLAGEPCRIQPNFTGEARMVGGTPGATLTPRGDGIYELSLAQGQSAVLADQENPGSMAIEPLAAQPGRSNTFGLNAVADAYRGARVQEAFELMKSAEPLQQWAGVMIVGLHGSASDAKALLAAPPRGAKGAQRSALGELFKRHGSMLRPALREALGVPASCELAIATLAEHGNREDLAVLGRMDSASDATRRLVLSALAASKRLEISPVLQAMLERAPSEARRQEIFATYLSAARRMENPARTELLKAALALASDEAMKKKIQEQLQP